MPPKKIPTEAAPTKRQLLADLQHNFRNGRPIVRLPTTTTPNWKTASNNKTTVLPPNKLPPHIEVYTTPPDDPDFTKYDRETIDLLTDYDDDKPPPNYNLTEDEKAFLASAYTTIQQKHERLEAKKKATGVEQPQEKTVLQNIKTETEAERDYRLEQQRQRQRRFYANETPEQKARRLERGRQYQAKRKQLQQQQKQL